jgi:hypothetical protein
MAAPTVDLVLSALAVVTLVSACTAGRAAGPTPGTVPRTDAGTVAGRERPACEQEVLARLDPDRARLVARHAGVGMLAWSLSGAWHGALTGALTHAGAGTGAWIGAAAGAGVGLTLGFVKGWSEAGGVRARYADAVDTCLASATSPSDEAESAAAVSPP